MRLHCKLITVSRVRKPLDSLFNIAASQSNLSIIGFGYCVVLQLGGKNAAVIFDDADLEKCISTTVRLVCSLGE